MWKDSELESSSALGVSKESKNEHNQSLDNSKQEPMKWYVKNNQEVSNESGSA